MAGARGLRPWWFRRVPPPPPGAVAHRRRAVASAAAVPEGEAEAAQDDETDVRRLRNRVARLEAALESERDDALNGI